MRTLVLDGVTEVRPMIDYLEPFAWDRSSPCTYCAEPAAVVVKHHWSNRPLGQLVSRCEYHWARYEAALLYGMAS